MHMIAKTEGWALNVQDYTTWLNSFEKFWFFAAIDKETDETIGSITMAFDRSVSGKEDGNLYCVGAYYVREEWRNSGVGSILFEKIVDIAKGSNMALHGALKMSPKYASKYGFDKMPNYKHEFASIPIGNLIIPDADPRYTLKDLKDVDEDKLVAYDAAICQRRRAKYLHNFITTANCYVKVALDNPGNIVGLCSVRSVLANYLTTAPLYADNQDVARSLLAGVLPMIEDIENYKSLASLYPPTNKEAHSLFQSLGGAHTTTMPYTQCAFTKKLLPIPEERVFGVLECANSFV
ncbi:hypothetical protein Y032_0351g3244 [Ancylostoma ceylanicum]|nr:hypothetical protein Y032_0351g3244 [Ancylostoma ceylanicum]